MSKMEKNAVTNVRYNFFLMFTKAYLTVVEEFSRRSDGGRFSYKNRSSVAETRINI